MLAVNLTRTVLMIVTVSSAGVLIPVSGPVATWQSAILLETLQTLLQKYS